LAFPFLRLPPGEVTPQAGPGDRQSLLERDIQIVRWFIRDRWGRKLNPDSPLGDLLIKSEEVNMNEEAISVDAMERESARYGLHLTVSLLRLAWAIRALHGSGGRVDMVDGSFIDDELLGADSTQPDAERLLPGGVGTLVFAGRLVQAGGGRILSVNGKRGRGHDIRWRTTLGDTVLVERKDRSYEAGLTDTQEKRAFRVVEAVMNAGVKMPRERGAARVLVVGFQHLVREDEAKDVDATYEAALKMALAREDVAVAQLPHLVVAEHLGLEPKAGGERFNFFSPQPLNPEPWFMDRVAPLLAKALGASV
jgi:hypothetical protein